MAGKGGGAWKVAYADFVTAMMAFFLVMWIVAQNKPVREAVANYFKHPYGTSTNPQGPPSLLPPSTERQAPKIRVPPKNSKGRGRGSAPDPKPSPISDPNGVSATKPQLLVLHDGDKSTLGAMIVFNEDSADLDNTGKDQLRELVPMLLGKPNKIEVRGHSTRKPLPPGSPMQDAWQLSYARCQAVMKFLEQKGIEPERFRLSQAGPFEPHTIRVEPELQAQNSRVEVYMLGEFVDDLQGTREERAGRIGSGEASLTPRGSLTHE